MSGNWRKKVCERDRNTAKVAINPKKVYDLPELIDLAERNNPDTQVAWESARKAAAAVGLSENAYYTYLMASAGAGYERAFIPFPTPAVDQRLIAQQVEQAASQGSLRKSQAQSPKVPNVSVVGGGTLATDAVTSQAALGVKSLLPKHPNIPFLEVSRSVSCRLRKSRRPGELRRKASEFYRENFARNCAPWLRSTPCSLSATGSSVLSTFSCGFLTGGSLLTTEVQNQPGGKRPSLRRRQARPRW